jgi:hypothetical protein
MGTVVSFHARCDFQLKLLLARKYDYHSFLLAKFQIGCKWVLVNLMEGRLPEILYDEKEEAAC